MADLVEGDPLVDVLPKLVVDELTAFCLSLFGAPAVEVGEVGLELRGAINAAGRVPGVTSDTGNVGAADCIAGRKRAPRAVRQPLRQYSVHQAEPRGIAAAERRHLVQDLLV